MSLLRSPLWFVLALALAGGLLFPFARGLVLQIEETPAVRGMHIAQQAGCFSCHGPGGSGGIKNPGSPDGEVPGFTEGTPMMWVNSDGEVREYILDGLPKRKAEDPKYLEKTKDQLLFMPAYRGFLSDREVDDVLAFIKATSGLIVPKDDPEAAGYDVAFELGCFDCHGPMGTGGIGNPGSFKGYIPGWWGDDFRELVRSDGELREWIEVGRLQRLEENPIASHFTRNQRIQMPAYKDRLDEKKLKELMAYVRWINEGKWKDMSLSLGH